jgi:hypothetical protein
MFSTPPAVLLRVGASALHLFCTTSDLHVSGHSCALRSMLCARF